jgi:hypothetical protein
MSGGCSGAKSTAPFGQHIEMVAIIRFEPCISATQEELQTQRLSAIG